MRNVILAVVVVVALTAAGIGGTLAGFSDSEISQDNVITTGSLDLKVNGKDDLPWGEGIGPKVVIEHMTPCKWYHFYIEVRNDGQCEVEPDLYIHFKKFRCENVPPEHGGIVAGEGRPAFDCCPYPFPVYPPDYGEKPEPELVAEYGGLVDQRCVNGTGKAGDGCTLASHIEVDIFIDGVEVTPVPVKLIDIQSKQLYLGKLPPCSVTKIITLAFHLQQMEDTKEWPAKCDPTDVGPVPEKFKYWPTNALMKDRLYFDIEFDLIQVDPA